MSKKSQLFGLLGAVLTLLGLIAFFFVGLSPYSLSHLIGGPILLLLFLIGNAATLPQLLRGRATRQFVFSMTGAALVLVILVAVNIMVVLYPKSWDMTREDLYSLSPQTLGILDRMQTQVKALLFVQGGQGGQVEDLLRQYDYHSAPFSFEVVDPEVSPELVQKYELTSAPILVLEAGAKFLKTSELSEEKITATLVQLEGGRKKTLYLLGEHGEASMDDDKGAGGIKALTDRLKDENYEVRVLSLLRTAEVPLDADAVMVIGSKVPLSTPEVEQLHRYLRHGGSLLLATDPGYSDTVGAVVAPLGLQFSPTVIIDQEVRLFAGPALGLQPVVRGYGDHPIARPLHGQPSFFRQACAIRHEAVSGVEVTELARTSPSSWAESDVKQLFNDRKADQGEGDIAGPVALGVVAQGYATPASTEPPLEGTAKIVAFCDTDFLTNQFVDQMANADLAINSLNWLTGKESNISIRPKSRTMSNLMISMDEMVNIFFVTVLILPELLLLLGMIIWWRRR